jgi:hypothetical protein
MTKKPTTLDAVMAKKAAADAPASATDGASGEVRTVTIRMPPIVHDQLREMSFVSRRSQQALVMEGLNLLFEKHGKPPIASD